MTMRSARGPGSGVVAATAGLAVAATAVQLGLLERVKAEVLDRVASAGVATLLRAAFRATDLVPISALLLAAAWLVRRALLAARAPAGLGALVPATRGARLAVLLLGAWTFLRWHGAPGFMAGYDVDLHVSAVSLAAREVALGRYPTWTDAWYLGFPLLRYYGAAFLLPAAVLAATVLDVRDAAKVTAAAWHLLGAPAAYLLARTTGASRGAALVAGIAYAASPYFVCTLAHAGSLTAAPVIALVPALLAFALRAARAGGTWSDATGLGGVGALLLWAHPAYAAQAAVLAVLLFFGAALRPGGGGVEACVRGALATAVAASGALPVLHAWLVDGLPRAGAAPGAWTLVRPGLPNPDAIRLLLTWTLRPSVPTGYVGLVGLGLAGFGAARGVARGTAVLGFGLLVLLVASWCGPGFVRERALFFVPVLLVPPIASALDGLARATPRGAVLAAALLAIDLALGGLASPYRADLDGLGRDLAAETSAQGGAGRTVLVGRDASGDPVVGEWQVGYEAPLRTLCGGFREAAPPAYAMLKATLGWVEDDPDLHDPGLRRHLSTLGVTSVRRMERRALAPETLRLDPTPRVRFATETALAPAGPGPTPDLVAAWSAATRAPEGSGPTAIRRVLFPGDGPPLPASDAGAPLPGLDVVRDVRAGPHRDLEVRAPSAGWVRLDDAWVSGIDVRVDGRAVAARADVFGLVAIPLETGGAHTITLDDPTSTRFWPGPALAFLVVLGVGLAARRRGRPAAPGSAP